MVHIGTEESTLGKDYLGATSGYQQPLLELTLLSFILSWLKSNSLEGEAGLLVISSTRKTVFVHFSNHRDEN